MGEYKTTLIKSMDKISQNDKVIFMGYNVLKGNKANGTLINIPEKQLYEMPVAENLMMSSAIGMSLGGYKPVLFFERFDFILNAMDSLINHLDKAKDISCEEFNPKVLIRVVVGGKNKPFYNGETHSQDFTDIMKQTLKNIEVINIKTVDEIKTAYNKANEWEKSMMIIEYKDLY